MIGRVVPFAFAVILALGACTAIGDPAYSAPTQPNQTASSQQVETPDTILFVGNSYFYYNDSLHNHVRYMVEAAGVLPPDKLTYKSATIGGAALADHPIEHLVDHRNLRVDEPFDVVILQDISSAALSERGRERFARTVKRYAATVRAAGAEPVLYMTHAYVPPNKRASPDMTGQVARMYMEAGEANHLRVIPVGLAFAEAYRRRPDIRLHQAYDGSHPNLLGTYLAAATVFATLYGRSPVGSSYDYFGAVPKDEALFLQQVAQDTVLAFEARGKGK